MSATRTEEEREAFYKSGEIDINNFLGDDFNSFKKKVYTTAIANTTLYMDEREDIFIKVKQQLTKDLYMTVYNLLTRGTNKDGTHVVTIGGKRLHPSLPIQQATNQAISCSNSLSDMLMELIDELLPKDAEDIFKKKLITMANTAPLA